MQVAAEAPKAAKEAPEPVKQVNRGGVWSALDAKYLQIVQKPLPLCLCDGNDHSQAQWPNLFTQACSELAMLQVVIKQEGSLLPCFKAMGEYRGLNASCT